MSGGPASSPLRALLAASRAALHTLRVRAAPVRTAASARARVTAQKWGGAATIGAAVYFLALSPDVRADFWSHVRARTTQPFSEWRENRTHGARKRALLTHYGLLNRNGHRGGGDVLELLPGTGGASFAVLGELSKPKPGTSELRWTGLDVDEYGWKSGMLPHSAEMHVASPRSTLLFRASSSQKRSMLELLRELPDASMQHVLALHGLSPLFTAPPATMAALSTRPPLSQMGEAAQMDELRLLLREIRRVLRPGGHFIFLDEARRNEDDSVGSFMQRATHTVCALLPGCGGGDRTPISLPQLLPTAGFDTLHMEQWPDWAASERAPRRGVRVLRPKQQQQQEGGEVDEYTPIEGMRGLTPMVAGVATKARR